VTLQSARSLLVEMGVDPAPTNPDRLLLGLLEQLLAIVDPFLASTSRDDTEVSRLLTFTRGVGARGEEVVRNIADTRAREGKETIRLHKVAQVSIFAPTLNMLASSIANITKKKDPGYRKFAVMDAKRVRTMLDGIRVALDLEKAPKASRTKAATPTKPKSKPTRPKPTKASKVTRTKR
jgi:hypothetical protein